MKKILFITTSNLPTNPRLFKEMKLATTHGYEVDCYMFDLGLHWSTNLNNDIISNYPDITFHVIPASRTPFIPWLQSSLINKFCQFINVRCDSIAAYASNKRSWLLKKNILHKKYDLIIAHNLGALYPAYYVAKKMKTKFIFDVEDYHPGEFIRHNVKKEKLRRDYLMRKLLPHASFLSSASPLIEKHTINLIKNNKKKEIKIPPHKTILNSFPENEFISPIKRENNTLKLIWFSQKISFGRGLEQLFESIHLLLKKNEYNITLTLIGDLDPLFEQQIIQPLANYQFKLNLVITPPLSQLQLHSELANHDVGLALEPGKDLNNNLAISNKIIAYAQAGLYILATNTPAQEMFIKEDEERGIICKQTTEDIENTLSIIINNINDIKGKAFHRYEKAKSLSWEQESTKVQNIWSNLIQNS